MRVMLLLACAFTLLASEWTTTSTSRANWVAEPGGADRVVITLVQQGQAAWRGTFRLELCDARGRRLQQHDRDLTVEPGRPTAVEHDLSFAELPAGEHLLRWRLFEGPAAERHQVAGWERSLMIAGREHAFILLDREPVARGIELIRNHVQPVEIISGGLKRWVWKSTHGSAAQGWWRSHRFRVTDPAFRNGAAPVIDVETWSVHRSDAPINLAAHTRNGGLAETGWGGRGPGYNENPPWKHLIARIDDAVLGGGMAGAKPEDHWADNCDLRYNACTADGELRSLVMRRYDLQQRPEWPRLLRLLDVDCGSERYVFTPGTRLAARVRLANRARIAYRASADVAFLDAHERVLWSRRLPVTVGPEAEGDLAVPIDTTGLAYGVYILRTRIGEHLARDTLIGISDLDPLPTAREGEFLYGTDLGGRHDQPGKLDWAAFMGMDIIRNLGRAERDSIEDIDRAVAELRARGMRGTMMLSPAWEPDPAKRAERNRHLAAFASEVAQRHRGWLRWWELGNEPDLPFFYAGPIDAYIEGYRVLHAAIKAADPEAMVMNGGLCFHGAEGNRRAHELIAKIPNEMVDAWAYHGHGPGIGAERRAWQRQDVAVRAVGKGDRHYIETESGLSALDWPARRRQAQTIVQKAVFAQSVKAPLFLWFNLHMGGWGDSEWGYTTIERGREPRPAVLAHRAMVKVLRGLAHAGTLDLLAPQAEGHLFAAADDRRALVAWSDRSELTRTLAIGPRCRDLRLTDLYGNSQPLVEPTPGFVQLACGADPVFVSWTAGDPAFAVHLPPPPLLLPDRLRVVPGRSAVLPVTVRDPGQGGLSGDEVRVSTRGEAPAAGPERTAVRVTSGGHHNLALPVAVRPVAPSVWPRQWTVFAPVEGDIDLARFTDIPRALPAKGGQVAPTIGIQQAHDLDLGALTGGFAERRQAVCFAWLDSDREQEVEFGAGADWWMEWYVNGRRVFATMEHGNQGPYHVLTHVWKTKLAKGRNLVAVRVLSGSGGWRLVAGGPDEVAAARRERAGTIDALRIELHAGAGLLARQDVAVEVLLPVERVAGPIDWEALAPDGMLGPVDNRFVAVPDASRHHQGRDDLSGQVWLRDDGSGLRVAVAVRDDLHRPGDGADLLLATGVVFGQAQTMTLMARRDDAARLTWYETTIPRASLGSDRFAVAIRVRDDDWGELKQTAAWGAGDDPERWHQAWCR